MILLTALLLTSTLPGDWLDLYSSGRWEESYDTALEVLEADSSKASGWAVLALSAATLGMESQAELWSIQALELDSLSAPAWTALGRSRSGSLTGGRKVGPLAAFDLALELDPLFVPAMVGRAHGLAMDGLYDEALAELDRGIQLDPGWISLWLKRSEVLRLMGEPDSALSVIETALELWPGNRSLLFESAWLMEMTQDPAGAEAIYRWIAEEYPRDTDCLVDLGMLLEDQERFGEAVKVYREMNARDSTDYWCLGEMGFCLEMTGSLSGARESYLAGLEVNPLYSFAQYRLGLLEEGQGDYETAFEWYAAAVESDPSFVDAWISMGLLQEELNRFDEAAESYRRALKWDPYYAWAWGELALVLEQQGKMDEAALAYEEGVAVDPDYNWAWEQRGLLFEDAGELEAAAEWYSRGAREAAEPGVWLLGELAFIHQRLNNPDSAIVYYSRALATDSAYTFGLQRLAPLLARREQYGEALELWDRYMESEGFFSTALCEKIRIYEELDDEETLDSLRQIRREEYPYGWIDLAWTYSIADPATSLSLAERAEEDPPYGDGEFWLVLAGLYSELGEGSRADEAYETASVISPDSIDIWLDWGYHLFDSDREGEAAEKYLVATQLDSLSFSAWSGYGEALLFSDDYDGAFAALDRSIQLDPNSPWVYAYMGLALEQKGDSRGAMDYYFKALSLSPGYDYAERRVRSITDTGFDADWNRWRSETLAATIYVDVRVNNGNVRERRYSGGLEIEYQYEPQGSTVSLEADHSHIETSKDYASDYSWSMVTASIEKNLSDQVSVTASSSWDRQPGTVRPWQISSYLSFGYRKWVLDWLWLSPSLGVGQVNTHWASGLSNERTDRTTFYGSLSLWFEKDDSPLPSLWLWGNFYIPPDDSRNTLMNGLAELTFEMWDPLSLTLGYSVGYTRTPTYDYWEKYDTEFYSRLNLRLF